MRLDVLTSGIWQTTTTIVSEGEGCFVIDPAYFPRELEQIASRARDLGGAQGVLFTHGHWDHVMGHTALPGAPVWVSQVLADGIATADPRVARYLEDAREFDSRWYVPRPDGHRWPTALHGIRDDEVLRVAGISARTLHLPGHSPEGLGLVIEDVLVVGDYLSPCEIPFIDDATAYRQTLARLLDLLRDLREAIPGHGPRLTAGEAIAIASADLTYVDRLIAAADPAAALAVSLPRAADVVGMQDHHRENCAKLASHSH
ncbi:MAG: MBL fold metallo-hydrolase [Deltaproteobacteria bacterium]|nr:MBL fold metallo-hydrolase [Deltaproteobacteria bacterium]